MKVTHTKMVFAGGSRVPAGTPFEVDDKATLEPGMVKVDVEPKAPAKGNAKTSTENPVTTAKLKVGGDEPETLAALAKAQAEADKKADPARG